MKLTSVVWLIMGRDEAVLLPKCLASIRNQTVPPKAIIFVDDASMDDTAKIAESFGCVVRRLTKRHPYWTYPELAEIYNEQFKVLYESRIESDFLMISACDAVYPPDYTERLVEKMNDNQRLAICGGILEGEPCGALYARGCGRLIRRSFWDEHVKFIPFKDDAETEPIRIARQLGFEVQSFPDVVYKARPTKGRTQ